MQEKSFVESQADSEFSVGVSSDDEMLREFATLNQIWWALKQILLSCPWRLAREKGQGIRP